MKMRSTRREKGREEKDEGVWLIGRVSTSLQELWFQIDSTSGSVCRGQRPRSKAGSASQAVVFVDAGLCRFPSGNER